MGNNMKKLLLNLCVMNILLCGLASAEVETKRGTIIHKGWTKSIQSYHAGGSDYFILDEGDVIFFTRDFDGKRTERTARKKQF